MSDEPVIVARVARAHGIRGGLLLDSETDAPEALFRKGRRLRVAGAPEDAVPGRPREIELVDAQPHAGRWLVTVREVSDRTTAETLRGATLTVPRGELPEFSDEAFLLHDLIGLSVVQGDRVLGEIRDVYDLPAGPMLSVRVEGRDRLIPFDEQFVIEVDFDEERVLVELPEGLLDL
jgi:16S rRNA processing protein RimM